MKYAKSLGVRFCAYGSGMTADSYIYGCGRTKEEAFTSLILRKLPDKHNIIRFSLRESAWYEKVKKGIKEQERCNEVSHYDIVGRISK